ncbi:hypothetical protein NYE70_00385 [Paenibacillus sp. FSL R5-0407]|uniref:hypothetical protein n=1 Tax=Paenibacillus TaxID=44249 RepID=UPI0025B6A777|nr:hypothetical protein [Paenibacillus vini]MDN4069505.1 hypothetical protein [Paenibacillus vini]
MNSFEQGNMNGMPPYREPNASPVAELKHSGPGIASFIIILVAIVGYIFSIAMITAAVIGIVDQPIEAITESLMEQAGAILGILLMMVAAILHLVALILGIIGLLIKNRKKLFAILGLSFSGGILILLIILFALGSL